MINEDDGMDDQHIDRLLDSIEAMMDAQDDIWQEQRYCNYRFVNELKESRYLPAKQAAREAFKLAVVDLIKNEISRQFKAKDVE